MTLDSKETQPARRRPSKKLRLWSNQPFVGYASAVAAVALAYLIRVSLDPVLDQGAPFLPFVLAVVSAVLLSGRGPGVLAGLLSVLAGLSFFEPADRYTLQAVIQVAIFMLVCLGVGWLEARRSAQAAIAGRASRELELFVNQVQDYAIFMVDGKGRVRTWNAGAERLFGWPQDRIIGSSASMFLSGPNSEEHAVEQLGEARRQGRFAEEVWQRKLDGSEFLADVSISHVVDERGAEIGFAKVIFDTTSRRAEALALKHRESI